ncbi:MAG: hypothetical protein A2095_04185 [Sphingomonadales bacterium GWF1_63_6]|nr:MAG: hypothetical protein A2095_04185 [Sphingomonadales bacterium GWF1_63_6]
MSERDAIVADGEDPISILLDAADNIADYHDGGWGLSRKVVDAAKADIATHAGEVERLREALRRIEKHYGADAEGETESMRQIARQALEASR